MVIQQQKDSMESNNHHDKNPSPPPVKHGPDSLQVKCINDDSICYLSSYKKDWLHSRIEHSVKITVDLNSPDRATVEQKGPFIHLPTE